MVMTTPDVFFVTYGEAEADKNWLRLLEWAPNAVPVEGIDGIHHAHRACAERATTDHFIVVDGDNWIESMPRWPNRPVDNINPFDPNEYEAGVVYVWRALNPVNGLVYGHGGVKALPTEATRAVPLDTVDMTSAVSPIYRKVNVIASQHRFNTSPYETWRTAFRECVKLSSKVIPNQQDSETNLRLDTWCSHAMNTGRYADECVRGAIEGRVYGGLFKDDPHALRRINDFCWLQGAFREGLGRWD